MKRILRSVFVNILILWLLWMESSHCRTKHDDIPEHDVYHSDYYKRLGINRKATQKDVKSAFRKLGFKYHPDKCKESDCEKKFQKISEAYTVLSDAEKRAQYDNFGASENLGGSGASGQGFGSHPGSFNFNFDDLFGNFAGFGDENEGSFGRHFKVFSNFPDVSDFSSSFGRKKAGRHEYGDGSSYFGQHFGGSQRASRSGGRTCKTVTQRVGNTITTYTTCT